MTLAAFTKCIRTSEEARRIDEDDLLESPFCGYVNFLLERNPKYTFLEFTFGACALMDLLYRLYVFALTQSERALTCFFPSIVL